MIVLNRKDEGGKVDIKLNGEEVNITEKKEAIRILGSWINGFGNKKAQEKKIREATTTVVNTVARKKVNGEITRYILNQVLCPRLEYLMIDYVFPKSTRSWIDRKMRGIFKAKACISGKTPNCYIHRQEFFKVFSIEDRHLKRQTKWLKDNLEDRGLVGETMRIRLIQAQTKQWQESSILKEIKKNGRSKQKSRILGILSLLQENNTTLEESPALGSLETKGGKIPIEDILKEDFG